MTLPKRGRERRLCLLFCLRGGRRRRAARVLAGAPALKAGGGIGREARRDRNPSSPVLCGNPERRPTSQAEPTHPGWKSGRVAEGSGFLNRQGASHEDTTPPRVRLPPLPLGSLCEPKCDGPVLPLSGFARRKYGERPVSWRHGGLKNRFRDRHKPAGFDSPALRFCNGENPARRHHLASSDRRDRVGPARFGPCRLESGRTGFNFRQVQLLMWRNSRRTGLEIRRGLR